MLSRKLIASAVTRLVCLLGLLAAAHGHADNLTRPDSHAPIAVMGDHVHHQGEFMFSYRYMHMAMKGNRDGSESLSPEQIVTTVENRFANPPMQPPFLRVVPLEMTMEMHMLGAMYAPNDHITLMLMGSYVEREMDHITFMGPVGSTPLGTFTTETSGFGDTSLSALVRLNSVLHLTAGWSFPTGDIKETDTILTPMGTTPSPRLPYPMQLGSGTYDPMLGLTYADRGERWGWGAQWRSKFRMGDNDEGYSLGDELRLSAWSSYRLSQSISLSARLEYFDRDNINGIDRMIVAPVQTADPDNHGVERLEGSVGINRLRPGSKHRLALEWAAPISQRLDGPQMETDWTLSLGWQWAP
ncbi:MAG: transporter [Pseudomonadales bacterium]